MKPSPARRNRGGPEEPEMQRKGGKQERSGANETEMEIPGRRRSAGDGGEGAGAQVQGGGLWLAGFRTISLLSSTFRFLKKINKKGMMEKGRESDKFNDVCSKLRLEK